MAYGGAGEEVGGHVRLVSNGKTMQGMSPYLHSVGSVASFTGQVLAGSVYRTVPGRGFRWYRPQRGRQCLL